MNVHCNGRMHVTWINIHNDICLVKNNNNKQTTTKRSVSTLISSNEVPATTKPWTWIFFSPYFYSQLTSTGEDFAHSSCGNTKATSQPVSQNTACHYDDAHHQVGQCTIETSLQTCTAGLSERFSIAGVSFTRCDSVPGFSTSNFINDNNNNVFFSVPFLLWSTRPITWNKISENHPPQKKNNSHTLQ